VSQKLADFKKTLHDHLNGDGIFKDMKKKKSATKKKKAPAAKPKRKK